MGLVKAAVIGAHTKPMEMVHRRVGGIVKGIATLEVCKIEDLHRCEAQLLLAYAHGSRLRQLVETSHLQERKVLGVELTLLPVAVKTLRLLNPRNRLGVVAEHQACANYFLSEIVRSGVMDHQCVTGTFSQMAGMDVDRFVVSEEMAEVAKEYAGEVDWRKVILVPRTVSAQSAAEIINTVLEIAKRRPARTPRG